MNQKKSFNSIDNILLALWGIGSAVAISIIIAIFKIGFHDVKSIAPLTGAFAILISAGIASTSVMKSIHTTQQNEKKKAEKEESKFFLDKCIKALGHVHDLIGNRQNNIFSWRDASSSLLYMKEISKLIMEESHKKIFAMEFSQHSSKLFQSFMTKNGEYNSIKPTLFCYGASSDDDLKMAFEKSDLVIDVKFILPVIDFAEPIHNNFLENSVNYEDWKNIDLKRPNNSLLNLCFLEYINLYKEKFPANKVKK